MCKNDILFQNRVQNYTFLRTQPNKMHKNSLFVHKKQYLCNNSQGENRGHVKKLKILRKCCVMKLFWVLLPELFVKSRNLYNKL